jgi:hypothetical protein
MSKMGSHEPFGHLQHKLWQKERSGVKLAVWLPTTKSRESTWPWCVQVECDTPLERSWRGLQLWFRPHCKGSYAPSKLQESQLEFRGSHLGVPGQKAIWMWPPWRTAEYTIWEKVVASPKSGLWWVFWVQSCLWLVLTPKVLQKVN